MMYYQALTSTLKDFILDLSLTKSSKIFLKLDKISKFFQHGLEMLE